MKYIALILLTVGVVSTSISASQAAKKCPDGWVWDEEIKKCVTEPRGSF